MKLKRKIESFRSKILMYMVGGAILISIVTSGVVCLRASKIREQMQAQNMREGISHIQFNLENLGEKIDLLATMVYLSPDVIGALHNGGGVDTQKLMALDGVVAGAQEAGIVTDPGLVPVLYISDLPENASLDFTARVKPLETVAQQAWYRQLDKKQLVIVGVLDNDQGNKVVRIAKRLYDIKGAEFLEKGLITVDIDLNDMADNLSRVASPNGGGISLCDANGVVMASSWEQPGQALADRGYIDKGEGDHFVQQSPDGADEAHYVSVRFLSKYDLWMVCTSPAAAALQPIGNLVFSAALVTLLSACIAAMLGMVVARRLVDPLEKLVASMRNFAKGQVEGELEFSGDAEFDELISSYNEMAQHAGTLMQKSVQSEKSQREAEFQALQAQIHPHFLYNTLDAVNWLAIAHDVPDISTIVTALSDFFRLSLSGGKNIITLQNEFKHVKSYLEILKVRLGDAIGYEMDLPAELSNCAVAKLTLQPLVENSIEHGLRPKDDGGTVRIYARRQDDQLVLYVEDDGVGCSMEELNACMLRKHKSSSFGVYNVSARIKTVYGEGYGLSYEPRQGGGLVAKVILPIKGLDDMDNMM